MARADLRTAFDVAQPKYVVEVMKECSLHGGIIAAILNEMVSSNGRSTLEDTECTFAFNLMYDWNWIDFRAEGNWVSVWIWQEESGIKCAASSGLTTSGL